MDSARLTDEHIEAIAENMLRDAADQVGYTFRSDWRRRVQRLAAVLADHPDAIVVACCNEKTGVRFGKRLCRVGRCRALGHTCTDGQGSGYRLWATWATHDLATG